MPIGLGRQTASRCRSGCAGEPTLPERLVEDGDRRLCPSALERLALDDVPAEAVRDGERVAVPPVVELELTLEIRAPDIVRSYSFAQRSAVGSSICATTSDQPEDGLQDAGSIRGARPAGTF